MPVTFGATLKKPATSVLEELGFKETQLRYKAFEQRMPELEQFKDMSLDLGRDDHWPAAGPLLAPVRRTDTVTVSMKTFNDGTIDKTLERKVKKLFGAIKEEPLEKFLDRVFKQAKEWGEFYNIH